MITAEEDFVKKLKNFQLWVYMYVELKVLVGTSNNILKGLQIMVVYQHNWWRKDGKFLCKNKRKLAVGT